jgi:hypothetical protein
MNAPRIVGSAVIGLLLLSGCAADVDRPAAETSESSSSVGPEVDGGIESLAEIGGTEWAGPDSDGDDHLIEFADDGTLTHNSFGNVQESTWEVQADVLSFTLDFGGAAGEATITATLDPDSGVLFAEGVDGAGTFTMELSQRR